MEQFIRRWMEKVAIGKSIELANGKWDWSIREKEKVVGASCAANIEEKAP